MIDTAVIAEATTRNGFDLNSGPILRYSLSCSSKFTIVIGSLAKLFSGDPVTNFGMKFEEVERIDLEDGRQPQRSVGTHPGAVWSRISYVTRVESVRLATCSQYNVAVENGSTNLIHLILGRFSRLCSIF